jgi:hypothetical protein
MEIEEKVQETMEVNKLETSTDLDSDCSEFDYNSEASDMDFQGPNVLYNASDIDFDTDDDPETDELPIICPTQMIPVCTITEYNKPLDKRLKMLIKKEIFKIEQEFCLSCQIKLSNGHVCFANNFGKPNYLRYFFHALASLDRKNLITVEEKARIWANKSKIKMSEFWIDLWKKNRDDETMIVDN